jgi:hypothetical protein
MRARQASFEPAPQFRLGPHLRHALMVEGGEHGAANHDLAACIALAVSDTRPRQESILFRAQPGQTLSKAWMRARTWSG